MLIVKFSLWRKFPYANQFQKIPSHDLWKTKKSNYLNQTSSISNNQTLLEEQNHTSIILSMNVFLIMYKIMHVKNHYQFLLS